MFKWFRKDPAEALQKKSEKLLVVVRDLQRKGDIIAYAGRTAEAEQVRLQIDEMQSAQN